MSFPKGYEWLGTVGTLPKMVTEALKLYGTHEIAGPGNSPAIMAWAEEVGEAFEYTADSIAWCGLLADVVATRAGYKPPAHPLWALNWSNFGNAGHQPCLGDVLVFVRPGGGHVGIYIAEDHAAYYVLGGNTHDSVIIAPLAKERLHAVRSPAFKAGRPASSKPYIVRTDGRLTGVPLSRNEA